MPKIFPATEVDMKWQWLSAALLVFSPIATGEQDWSRYVQPFIGSEGSISGTGAGGGDIWVGASLPFGSVKFGIDTTAANASRAVLNGGWTPDGNVTAITGLHVHGTGGAPKYGVGGPQMPLTNISPPINLLDNSTYSQPRIGHDEASVGYFKSRLQSGVTIELSASRHAGHMEYSFPPSSEKHVLVDVSHYLPAPPGGPSDQKYVGGEIHLQPGGKVYSGFGIYIGGWNIGPPMTVYFCGNFDSPADEYRTFRGYNTDPVSRYQTYSNGPIPQARFNRQGLDEVSGPMNDRIGALFSWNSSALSSKIASKVGISWISEEKACSFINEEIPHWNLNATRQMAVDEWNRDVFSKIQVPTGPGANETKLQMLYSNLYQTHLMPSDRIGENPLWETEEPWFDDFYTLWDIFRCTVSLFHLLQPTYYEGMIRALIEMWRRQGYMPDGRSGNYNGYTQGGSNADNVLADAYVKGLRGGINWTDGYAAMVKDAEVLPFNNFDPSDMTGSTMQGRGALEDWLKLGWLAEDVDTRCVSRTVEYSANDFALSQVARGEAADPADVGKYLNRSAGWQQIWLSNVTSLGFSGFMAPRLSSGMFNDTDYDPLGCGSCEGLSITNEGVPWEYSFTVAHDMQTLIAKMGGTETFEKRLDKMFEPNAAQQSLGVNGAGITTIFNIGNEPDFATPYLYNYIGKSWKSVQSSREQANLHFNTSYNGLPGNSDAGALNSWLVWQMIGLFPVVTQPVYLLHSPWFESVNVSVGLNATLHISAPGMSDTRFWVQGVKLNGQQWDRNWFNHDELMVDGGTLEFEMGEEPMHWETGPVPPSPGHVDLGELGF